MVKEIGTQPADGKVLLWHESLLGSSVQCSAVQCRAGQSRARQGKAG